MPRLIASVGSQGTNRKNDVIVVQRLLNKHKIPRHPFLLKIDGIAGSKTIKQIIGFQKHNMNMRTPDGRVDPNGRTIRVLGKMTCAASNSTKGKNLYNLPFPYRIDHIPKSTPKNRRSGRPLKPKYLTIHSTANPKSSARNERGNLTNINNQRAASFHIVVDEKEAIEAIPLSEAAIHAGDGSGPGNRQSIGMEICESGDRAKTLENAALLAAKILQAKGLDITKLKRHYDWKKIKKCPGILLEPARRKDSYQTWEWFVSEVSKCIKKEKTQSAIK